MPPDPPVDVDVTPFLGTYERPGVRMDVRRDDDGAVWVETTPTGPLPDVLPLDSIASFNLVYSLF